MRIEISLQSKQEEAFDKSLDIPVLFYGGAKGGGKSYLVRAREIYRRLKYPKTKGLIVRKTYPELLSNHIRMFLTEYPEVVNWYKLGEKAIYYPNGSITEFSHLASVNDVFIYQGREYEDISIDEITQHEELVFKILRSSNRTANKEFTKAGGKVSMLLTGNPGGIGHGWAKRLFIDKLYNEHERPEDFGFVQAKVWDNKALLDADPDYLRRLRDLPDSLRRAYLEGDWDVFAGQVFSEFRRDTHTCNPVMPKETYPHFLWIDWGYSGKESHEGAFAGLAAALIKEDYQGISFNRIIVYKEWYGKYKHPKEWAEKIYKESSINYKEVVGDSAMFNNQTDGSKPIAKLMEDEWDRLHKKHWVTMKAGTKNRLGRVATVHNWLSLAPDGLPYMLVTESCPNLIRTLPLLVYDTYNVEDVDSDGEDHLYDSLGYGLSAVKFISANIGGISREPDKKKYLPATVMELDLTAFEKAKQEKNRDWKSL
jgi:phage terminase large subunit